MKAEEISKLFGKITINDKEYLLIEEKVLQSLLSDSSPTVSEEEIVKMKITKVKRLKPSQPD